MTDAKKKYISDNRKWRNQIKGKILGCPDCGGFPALSAGMTMSSIHCTSCGLQIVHNSKQEVTEQWNGPVPPPINLQFSDELIDPEDMKPGPAKHIKLTEE